MALQARGATQLACAQRELNLTVRLRALSAWERVLCLGGALSFTNHHDGPIENVHIR